MAFLLGFLDCLPFRRLLSCDDATRDDHEQDAVHQQRPSSGYYPESTPTGGTPRRPSSSLSRSMRFNRMPRGSYNRPVHCTWYGGRGGRSPSNRARSRTRRVFERRMARSNRANHSASSLSSTLDENNNSRHSFNSNSDISPRREEGLYYSYMRPRARPPPTLSLPAREMHVINALFYRPGVPRVAEIEWKEFLRAMRHIGFSGSPNDGSCYRFRVASGSEIFPVQSRGEVITAHQPHGRRTTLSLIEMREIGQRMSNAFGWSADTFTSKG